jgi:hypothetical protein
LADATATSRRAKYGPSEVHWVEQLHVLLDSNLDRDLRNATRGAGVRVSIRVSSAFIHVNPFKISPRPPVTKAVEAGDIVIVGDNYDDHGQLVERQALLASDESRLAKLDVTAGEHGATGGAVPSVATRRMAEFRTAGVAGSSSAHPQPNAAPRSSAWFPRIAWVACVERCP